MSYQPETQALNWNGKYRPMYRLKPDANWTSVRREFDTASQAITAAQMIVEAQTRPIRVHEEELQPLGSIEDWRREKDQSLAAEREKVMANLPRTTVYPGKGRRPVKVEIKGRKVA